MADYKLRIDIDEKKFIKKIQDGLKQISQMALPGFEGNDKYKKQIKDIDGFNKRQQKHEEYMVKLKHKLRMEYSAEEKYRQTSIKLLAKENALIRLVTGNKRTYQSIGGLFGGRMGGGVGKAIDVGLAMRTSAKERKKNENQQKLLNIKQQFGAGTITKEKYGSMTDAIMNPKKGKRRREMIGKAKGFYNNSKFGKSRVGKGLGKAGKGLSTPVKIAGIAAGLAGAAGLSKMIIDSSPMLKQMLKILNVGVMLILRPIGDFIGFMLRPLLIEFVKKIAIPMYRDGFKAAKSWGTALGHALLDLFTDPGRFIWNHIIKPIGDFFKELEIFGAKPFGGINTEYPVEDPLKEFKEGTLAAYDKYGGGSGSGSHLGTSTGLPIQGPVQEIPFEDLVTVEGEQLVVLTSIEDLLKQQGKTSEAKMVENFWGTKGTVELNDAIEKSRAENPDWFDPDKIAQKQQAARMARARAIEEERQKKLKESGVCPSNPYGNYANPNFGLPYNEERDNPQTPHIFPKGWVNGEPPLSGPLAEYKKWQDLCGGTSGLNSSPMPKMGPHSDIDTEMTARDYWSKNGKTGFDMKQPGFTEVAETVEGLQPLMSAGKDLTVQWEGDMERNAKISEEVSARYNDIMQNTISQTTSSSNAKTQAEMTEMYAENTKCHFANIETYMGDSVTMMSALRDKVESVLRRAAVRSTKNDATVAQKSFQGICTSLTPTLTEASRYKITWGSGSSQTMTLSPAALQYYNNLRATGQGSIMSIQKMAKGGILNEPVLGFGQNTGKGYLMGESGPEAVVPLNGKGGSTGGNTFNITINASNVQDVERKLKPTILRILKESTSRAGIV